MKPHPKPRSVTDYLASLPPDRKRTIGAVRRLIKQHLPKGYEETVQYGMISYVVPLETYPAGYLGKKDVPLPYISLASQKNHMAVYLMGIYGDSKLAKWFTTAWKRPARNSTWASLVCASNRWMTSRSTSSAKP